MKFAGQVRIPEVDHPGVPAVFLIEEGQAEVLLEGESLGRWSLFDVHASRLVSSAFSVSLGDDEITFLADEPMDFAYKGVEHMAAEWARYKTMTIPRRMVAVKLSRRGTSPSRIAELRAVMLENLRSGSAAPIEPDPLPAPAVAAVADMPVIEAPVTELDDGKAASAPPQEAVDDLRRRLRPGPGLASGRIVRSPAAADAADMTPDRVVEEEAPLSPAPVMGDSEVAAVASAEVVDEVAPGPEVEGSVEEVLVAVEEPPAEVPDEGRVEEPPSPEDDTSQAPEEAVPIEELGPAAADEGEHEIPDEAAIEELVPDDEADSAAEPGGVAAAASVGPPPFQSNGKADGGVVVDLGEFEDPDSAAVPTAPAPVALGPVTDEDSVLVGASSDKSGLLGAVRAAFVRNREPHVHEFVEAPGGIGITRHICGECGYISIGTTD